MAEPSVINAPPAADPAAPPAADPPAADPPAADPPAADPPAALTPEEQKVADDKAAEEAKAKPPLTPEEQKAADEKAAKDELNAEGAPEEYADFNMPDGVEVDTELLAEFTPLAKELDLNQNQAQKLVDFEVGRKEAEAQRQWDVWEKTQDEWAEASKNDPEIGGEKFQENLGYAKKAMDAYGSQELKDLADATGVGNHAAFIRLMTKIGKDTSEDKLNVGGALTKEGDRASRIYDKS